MEWVLLNIKLLTAYTKEVAKKQDQTWFLLLRCDGLQVLLVVQMPARRLVDTFLRTPSRISLFFVVNGSDVSIRSLIQSCRSLHEIDSVTTHSQSKT